MSRLGAYVSASTANPLGHRPHSFAQRSPMSVNPSLTGLEAYYPANYYVPTPLNIQMEPQANVLAGITDFLTPEVIGGILVLGALWYLMRPTKRGKRR